MRETLKGISIVIVAAVLILGVVAWSNWTTERRSAQAELRGAIRISNYLNDIKRYEDADQYGFAGFVSDDLWRYIDSLYDAAGEQMLEIDTTTTRIRGAI